MSISRLREPRVSRADHASEINTPLPMGLRDHEAVYVSCDSLIVRIETILWRIDLLTDLLFIADHSYTYSPDSALMQMTAALRKRFI